MIKYVSPTSAEGGVASDGGEWVRPSANHHYKILAMHGRPILTFNEYSLVIHRVMCDILSGQTKLLHIIKL